MNSDGQVYARCVKCGEYVNTSEADAHRCQPAHVAMEELANTLRGVGCPSPRTPQPPRQRQVVISVLGGVAEIAYASPGVGVAIVDFDNAEAEGKSGSHQLRYWIGKAKQHERQARRG